MSQHNKSRIEKLNKQEDSASDNCRNETCWWDYIKEQKTVKEADNNKLIKVTVIRKVGTYPDRVGDEYVKRYNIVKSEQKDSYEYFAFCAKKLPVLIDCDTKKCDVEFIPDANYERQDIYYRICNGIIGENEIPENLKVENLEIKLKNPLDIFDYYKKLFEK